MKVALHQVFLKKITLWMCLLLLFGALKIFSGFLAEKYYPNYMYIDAWVERITYFNSEDLESYIDELAHKVNSDEQYRKHVGKDFTALLKSYKNRAFVCNLINFAENGQGVLSSKIPDDFEKMQDFYRQLSVPSIINEQPLNRYFLMQSINFVPIFVLLLCAVIWGEHYENGIDKISSSTLKGSYYHRTIDVILISLSLFFLTVNEFFDLWYSGLLEHKYIWKCSVQSYDYFRYTQLQCNIGSVLLISFISKLIGMFCLNFLGMFIARWKRSVKESAIWTILILIALFFFGKSLENTKFYAIIQIGIVDWKMIISKIRIFSPLQQNTLLLGILFTILVAVAICRGLVLKRYPKMQILGNRRL